MGESLEGVPKVLQNIAYDFLMEQDGCFIEIRVVKLHKHLDFPLTSEIDEGGVRNFTNTMGNEKTIYIYIYIDKTGLGDLTEFQKASFDMFDCYCFDGCRNETINHAVEDLYNLRLKLKQSSTGCY